MANCIQKLPFVTQINGEISASVIQLTSLLISTNIPIFSLDPPASRLIFSPGNNSSCSVHSVSSPDSKLLRDLQFKFYRFIFTFPASFQKLNLSHSNRRKKKKRMVSKPPGFNKAFINEKKIQKLCSWK